MTVYADVLVVVNYIVNLLLLSISGRLMGAVISKKRLCLGALLGAFGSLSIFLPDCGIFPQMLMKLLLALCMAAAVFGIASWRRLFKALLVTFSVSFLFAGVMAAAVFFFSPAKILYYNGVVYFDLSVVQLIFWTAAAYLLLTLLEKFLFSRTQERKLYDLTVRLGENSVTLKGLGDTGHNLKEPFSGAPVIICDRRSLAALKPVSPASFRIIPCATVTGGAVLKGFHPDEIHIHGENYDLCTSDVYVAESREAIGGEYQALIHPSLLKNG